MASYTQQFYDNLVALGYSGSVQSMYEAFLLAETKMPSGTCIRTMELAWLASLGAQGLSIGDKLASYAQLDGFPDHSAQVNAGNYFALTNFTPTITQQPQDVTVVAGGSASFTVAATVTNGTLSYQWETTTGAGFTEIPGATSTTLALGPVQVDRNGHLFRVVVRANSRDTISRHALLTVTA